MLLVLEFLVFGVVVDSAASLEFLVFGVVSDSAVSACEFAR